MLGTQIIPGVGAGTFTTSSASQAGSELRGEENATLTLLAIIVPVSVILLIIIVVIVMMIVVIIKWRGKKTHSKVHRCMLHQKEALMFLLLHMETLAAVMVNPCMKMHDLSTKSVAANVYSHNNYGMVFKLS